MPQALKPGVIPLRPLTLSDIFNAAVAYVRANPKATLGLTAIVVVTAQIVSLILQLGPLAAGGELGVFRGAQASGSAAPGQLVSSVGTLGAYVTTFLSGILLSGMLTVVIGRAVFGSRITIGEAWARVRGRLLALIGFTALEIVGLVVLIAAAVMVVVGVAVVSHVAGILIGILLFSGVFAAVIYLGAMLGFTPVAIVLERLSIRAAIRRSFALIRRSFWRVFGIWLLAQVVAGVVNYAISIPFLILGVLGAALFAGSSSTTALLVAVGLIAIGGAIGQIITTPFTAGVVVLLYTDRRIRAEAFDLVLQTGATQAGDQPAESTDHLWLTPPPR